MIKLAFTGGDVMLGRLVNEMIHLNGPPSYVWVDFLLILGQADLRPINLECVISRGMGTMVKRAGDRLLVATSA